MRLWQYQSRFEPLSLIGENITLDKWYQVPVEVFRKKKLTQQGFSLVEVVTPLAESITLDKWYQPAILVFRRKQLSWQGFNLVEIITLPSETVTVDKWFRELSQPLNTITKRYYQSNFEPVNQAGEFITLDKWAQPLSQPRFDKVRRQFQNPSLSWSLFVPAPPVITGGQGLIVDEM